MRVFLLVALAVFLTLGCQPGKEDLVAQGRAKVAAQANEEAIKAFDDALAIDPSYYDALWGKAMAFGAMEKHDEQVKILNQILADKSHAKRASFIRSELDKVFRKQAEMAKKPEDREAFLNKAIEANEKSEANKLLAEIYADRGEKAIAAKQYADAEKAFLAVDGLRVGKKEKRSAASKARLAGFLAFREAFLPEFEKMKPELLEAGQLLDGDPPTFVVEGIGEATGKPGDEGFEAQAEGAANGAAATVLEDITYKLAGMARPEEGGGAVKFSAADVSVLEKGWEKKNRTFRVKVAVARDAVLEKVRELKNPAAGAAAQKPAAEEKKPAAEENKPAAEEKK
jgi:hypothetical protein